MKEKMKYRMRRLLSGVLSVMILFSSVPAYAASVGSNADDPSVGYDPSTGSSTVYEETDRDSSNTNVFLTVDDSNVVVGVPTTVILSGTPNDSGQYIGEYSVNVSGDISGDEQLVVEPKESSVAMKQAGKEDKTAVISQAQTSFTAEDLANNAQTTGAVTATGLTAGSWTADSVFVINAVSRYSLYSSLELAAADSNALTTDNADVMRGDLEHAVAGLYIQDDNVYIRMFKDESDIQGVTFSNDTELNLNDCTLEFAEGESGIYYTDNFALYNGSMNTVDASYIIDADRENPPEMARLSDVVFNEILTSSFAANALGVNLSGYNVYFDSVDLSITGEGNPDYSVVGITSRTTEGVSIMSDVSVYIETSGDQIRGMQGNNITIDNLDLNVKNTHTTEDGLKNGRALGVVQANTGTGSIEVNSCNINVEGNYAEDQNTAITGVGLWVYGSCVINGDENTTRIVCDGNNAIQANAGAKLTINGGYFAAPAHGGLYSVTGSTGSLEINGGTFVNNYDDYDQSLYGDCASDRFMVPMAASYITAKDGSTDQEINIRNAKFINLSEAFPCEEYVEQKHYSSGSYYGRGIVLKANVDGTTTVGAVNLYDCTILSRYAIMRIDGTDVCQVNFYGENTVLDGCLDQNGRLKIIDQNDVAIARDSGVYNDYTGLGLFENQLAGIRFVEGSKVVGSAEYTWTRWHGDWRFLELTIPDGIEWINYHAFYNCSYITTLTIPDSVTKISDGAFANCGWLRTVNISDELLIQLGNDGRIDDVFSGSPCVDTLTEQYNNLVAQG